MEWVKTASAHIRMLFPAWENINSYYIILSKYGIFYTKLYCRSPQSPTNQPTFGIVVYCGKICKMCPNNFALKNLPNN